tara:strand:- start:14075 stop:14494 length:420 start_codon:yes stop_codon:yes gene_type:complete
VNLIRLYSHEGRTLGALVEVDDEMGRKRREFRTNYSEYDAMDIAEGLDSEVKVHMKSKAYAVHRLLQNFDINPDDYVDDEDVIIHVANKGYKNLTELFHGDRRAWKLVKRRRLERDLFPELQPAGDSSLGLTDEETDEE